MAKKKQKRDVKVLRSSDKSASSDSDASFLDDTYTEDMESFSNDEIDYDPEASESSNSSDGRRRKNKKTKVSSPTMNSFHSSSEDTGPPRGKSPTDQQSTSRNDYKLFLVVVIVICFLAILARRITEEQSTHNSINVKELFLKDLDRCRTVSEKQSKRFWKKLNLTAQHLSSHDPNEPLTTMFASSPIAADTREHMAKMLATAYSKKCGSIYHLVDGNDYKSLQWELAKKRLDDDIKRVFLPGHACTLIVSNFHLLPPRAAELFFGLCDNDNADYKNASIIFTVEITHSQTWDVDNEYKYGFNDNEIPKPSHWDVIVDNFLTEYLKSNDKSGLMDNSRIAALMSRILPTVLWVQQENNLKCY